MGVKKTTIRHKALQEELVVANEQEQVALRWIHIEDLQIDPTYQRSDFINKSVVNKIANGFSWVLFGSLTVAERMDGSFWVVDGHHRCFGAKRLGIAKLPCKVFRSNGPAQEAEVFYDLNKIRTSINSISIYRALLRQGEEVSVNIQKLLENHGFCIAKNGKKAFAAAAAIREVYKRGVLDDVLATINDAFDDGSALRWKVMFAQAHFIQMLGVIYQSKKDVIDKERMKLVLARMDEKAYTRLASSVAGTGGNRAARIAPAFIEEFYNKALTAKKRIVW